MAINFKKKKKKEFDLNFLNKDFNSFQDDLRSFARVHYGDKVQDFSEAGLGGLFVDMAAYVGDVLSFYLDHQFNELDIRTAVESDNIERIARNSGLKLTGASPSIVEIEFYSRIPATIVNGSYVPDPLYLFKILQGTTISTTSGLEFELVENIDFAKKDSDGNLILDYQIGETTSDNKPINFIALKKGICLSASTYTETFDISSQFVPFRTLTLGQGDVSEIISVSDSNLNQYYEVDNLAQDTIFESVENQIVENYSQARSNLRVVAAPRRFITDYSRRTGKTSIVFGSGRSDTYENDVIPEPSLHSLNLFGDRKRFSKIAIDPNALLETNTLGTAPINTTLTIRYRAGGGSKFNVQAGSITQIKNLLTEFDLGGSPTIIRSVRASVEIDNEFAALGGKNRLNDEELRAVVSAGLTSQNRVVSKKDLIARIYTMPGQFGRFFRVGVRPDDRNPNASVVAAVCIDNQRRLQYATDLLKNNVATYLDEFRIIGDAVEILDAPIVNLGINFKISVLSTHAKQNVVSNVIQQLKTYLSIQNMQIDQPINISEIESIVQLTDGVNSVIELEIVNKVGNEGELSYIGEQFSILENVSQKMLYPPIGGIFEVRYLNNDIKGSAA